MFPISLVKGDDKHCHVLGLVQVMGNIEVLVFLVLLARPARLGRAATFAGVIGNAAVGTTRGARSPVVKVVGLHGGGGYLPVVMKTGSQCTTSGERVGKEHWAAS